MTDHCNCDRLEFFLKEGRVKIDYDSALRTYGIYTTSDSIQEIHYCPWCGTKLKDSLRDEWFNQLFKLGYDDPLFDDNIPEEYKTDEWWKKKGL